MSTMAVRLNTRKRRKMKRGRKLIIILQIISKHGGQINPGTLWAITGCPV